jgi:hypothetical protein
VPRTTTLARLVLLFDSQFDPTAAQKKSLLLPPVELDAGVSALNVDDLESATSPIKLKHSRKTPASGGLLSPGNSAESKKTDDGKKKC